VQVNRQASAAAVGRLVGGSNSDDGLWVASAGTVRPRSSREGCGGGSLDGEGRSGCGGRSQNDYGGGSQDGYGGREATTVAGNGEAVRA